MSKEITTPKQIDDHFEKFYGKQAMSKLKTGYATEQALKNSLEHNDIAFRFPEKPRAHFGNPRTAATDLISDYFTLQARVKELEGEIELKNMIISLSTTPHEREGLTKQARKALTPPQEEG